MSSVVAFFSLIPSETTLFYFIPAQTHTSPQRCVGLLYLCTRFQCATKLPQLLTIKTNP